MKVTQTLPLAMALALIVISVGAWRAGANSALAARPAIIATVDLERAINNLNELSDRQQELDAFVSKLKTGVETLDKELRDAQSALRILPPDSDDFNRKLLEVRRLTATLEFEGRLTQQLIDERKGAVYAELFRKISDAAGRLAKQSGYDFVLSNDAVSDIPRSPSESQIRGMIVTRRLLFATGSNDITDDLIQMLNNEHAMGRR
ncbi:MAG: OmpH family outer membrane protein [Phycisphaerales bacterium]|nr:MAG: OmpH family outer membrane protein [Phycisphaerales bacterium]